MKMLASKTIYYIKETLDPSLIQFSPPRTGSTLLWNTLRTIIPRQRLTKQHYLTGFQKSTFCRSRIVASIRDPLDSISSSILRYEKSPTLELIDQQLDEFERHGIWDLLEIRDSPRALILKYENFYNNWEFLFSQLESFFQTKITADTKCKCIAKYSIDQVEKKAQALGSFSVYDKEDHIHGKHISSFRGQVGYGKRILNEQMIEKIHKRFKLIFDEFEYN